ncbi:hypothetical protein [Paenibacillus chitinolyticus]|uniref:hypothetical protein n=1 Tax=Paenibacillus chitinolyticus TaxID=79263 RepID=UPI001C48DCCC|nr:hypothetical protein [Paenibacillus chitinolyticus]MBV6716499.1 hypothetical protein [Paenibacillus chitinolyticus]
MNSFGIKCERLLELRNNETFTAHIPPLYPIDPIAAVEFLEQYSGTEEELPGRLARYIEQREPSRFDQIKKVCGDLPWIVRSSGEEDLNETTNAGAYLSLVCERRDNFYEVLAQVMLSGSTEHARNQNRRFVNRHLHDHEPIPVFVQPLVQSEHAGHPVPYEATPYVKGEDLQTIIGLLKNLHSTMPDYALDCEWVGDSDFGTISMTSLTELVDGNLTGQIAFGFDLFSTQHVKANNSVRYLLPGDELNLWQGHIFQEVNLQSLFLVQTRPAKNYRLFQHVYELSASSKKELEKDAALCLDAKEFISQGGKPFFGKFIKAVTLNEAWNAYLQYTSKDVKEDIAAILVEFGTRTEHAGIMFNQVGIPVIRIEITLIPESMNYIVLDPFSLQCRLYSHNKEVKALQYETREITPLPDNCILVQDREEKQQREAMAVSADEHFNEALNKPFFSEKTKQHLTANSAYPDYGFIFHGEEGVRSPSYYANEAERLTAETVDAFLKSREWPEASANYFLALFHAKNLLKDGNIAAYFERQPEDRGRSNETLVYWKVLRIHHLLAKCSSRDRETLLERVRAEMNVNSAVIELRLDVLFLFEQYLDALCIYSKREEEALIQSFIGILSSVKDEDLPIVLDLARNGIFNAGHLCQFLKHAIENRHLFDLYRNYSLVSKEFAIIPYDLSVIGRFPYFNEVFVDLNNEMNKYESLGELSSSIFHTVVETYDKSAKEILLSVIDDGSPSYYQAYLRLLTEWLGLIRQFDKNEQVIQTFLDWIGVQEDRQAEIEDYFLEEIHWKTRIQEAEAGIAEDLSLTNLHQLHNVLHQWSLYLVPASNGAHMPLFVKDMVAFAQSFSEQENRLLRMQKDFFEIELAMCTHKAGFMFYKHSVSVEFSEPPSVHDDEIARLSAFASFMNKCNDWFEAYRFRTHYEKVAGTWTCYMTVKSVEDGALQQSDYQTIFHIIRFVLDSSYDFSHNPLSAVEDLTAQFNDPEWKDIFRKLVSYRVHFDDEGQFINLKLFAMSTFFTYLCLSPSLRSRLLSLYREGFDRMVGELAVLEDGMARAGHYSEWLEHYESATYTALFLAAIYPLETVGKLEALHDLRLTYDIVSRNLLKHKDAANKVIETLPSWDKALQSSVTDKLLHYCPAKFFKTVSSVNDMAMELSKRKKSFKRAKQVLLNAYADSLEPDILQQFIDDLQYVPYAGTEAQNQQLDKCLTDSGKKRYDIQKEILYI